MTRPKSAHPSSTRGSSLVVVLLCLAILSAMGVAFITQSTVETKIAGHGVRNSQALMGAEAGIAEVRARLSDPADTTNYISLPAPTNPGAGVYIVSQHGASAGDPDLSDLASDGLDNDLDTFVDESGEQYPEILSMLSASANPWSKLHYKLDGGGQVVKENGNPVMVITSRGEVGTSRRTVEIECAGSTPMPWNKYAAFGDSELKTSSGILTGTVGSNADVKLGDPVIGDAYAGGTVDHPELVSGTAESGADPVDLPIIDCPALPWGPAPTGASVSFDPSNGKVSASGGDPVYFADGTYYFSEFSKSGSGPIVINLGDQVDIYISKKFQVSGGITNPNNSAQNFRIWGCGTTTDGWSMSGDTDCWMMMYAPTHKIARTGPGNIHGSLIGSEISKSGSGSITFDSSLAVGSGDGVGTLSWREIR